MNIDLTAPIYNDEEAARKHYEASRWPNGPECPHCGVVGEATEMKGETTRPGLYNCRACDKPFTATIGTIFERSHIPMHKWLLAIHLMAASKKGISAHQLYRMLGFGSYRTAWFMAHRIRESMRELSMPPLGGAGKTAEADETFVGGSEKNRHKKRARTIKDTGGYQGKEPVFSIVERGGKVRSHHVPSVNAKTLKPILEAQLDKGSILMTDGEGQYRILGPMYAKHETVNHRIGEYVRGEAHTNTIESYFATLKRGVMGTYHHISQQHLKRYLCEFDFRYNERMALDVTDSERAAKVLRGSVGKRVIYQEANGKGSASAD
jgi:transposase-like protein